MWKQTSCFEMGPGAVCNPVSQAQQNYVITVPLADGTDAYIWTGDKWQQSPNLKYATNAPHPLRFFWGVEHPCPLGSVASYLIYADVRAHSDGTTRRYARYDQQPQTWIQLEFDGDDVLPFKYKDTFTLDVAV